MNQELKKRVLITGSAGMLGSAIFELLRTEKNRFHVIGIDNAPIAEVRQFYVRMDLLDFNRLKMFLSEYNPDIIIHCAAIVNVDLCEKDKQTADLLHYEVTRVLGAYNDTRSKLIYISTDAVFDGKNGNYGENDNPNPLNYYSKSKYRGESAALKSSENNLVVRTNIYGYKYPPGNSLAEWAIDEAKKNKIVRGFSDVFFNPLYIKQLSRIIKYLILQSETGVIHAGSREAISKYKFLIELYKRFRFSKDLITPISIDEIVFEGLRPKNTTLNINRLKEITGDVPSIYKGLDELVNDYINDGRMSHA